MGGSGRASSEGAVEGSRGQLTPCASCRPVVGESTRGAPATTATFMNSAISHHVMPTPMDRDFGDDPIRKRQRRRLAAGTGRWPEEDESAAIEEPLDSRGQ